MQMAGRGSGAPENLAVYDATGKLYNNNYGYLLKFPSAFMQTPLPKQPPEPKRLRCGGAASRPPARLAAAKKKNYR